MKPLKTACLLLVLLLTLAGCGERQANVTQAQGEPEEQTAESEPADPKYLPETSHAETNETQEDEAGQDEAQARAKREEKLRAKLDSMTLEEKVGQLFFVRCPDSGVSDKIAQYHLGGILLFSRDYKDSADNWLTAEQFAGKIGTYQLTAAYDTGIELFIGSDEEGGTVTRASRNPYLFPEKSKSPQELLRSGGLGALTNDAAQKNDLLWKYGINVNFAPVCDVSTDPNDFIYERSFGVNAAETMGYVASIVSVMNGEHVAAVLKHFPGYGNNADTHTGVVVDERPLEWFRRSDFIPFVGGIQAGAPFVLVCHNIVTCMDDQLPASLSPAVHRQLRELGFEGIALTDDLAMGAVSAYAADGSVAVMALRAGNDMVVTSDFETQIPRVIEAVRDGTLDEAVIDEACLRVLRIKLQQGLLKGWD
jgi:beta-N-acetylhexosaminidase